MRFNIRAKVFWSTMYFGRIALSAVRANIGVTVNSFIGKCGMKFAYSISKFETKTRIKPSSLMSKFTAVGAVGAVGAGCITTANAEGVQNSEKNGTTIPYSLSSNRLKNDICHMTPGISEVLLDIIDVLQENCDNYLSRMRTRINEMESNLQKYGSTMSLNLSDEEMESFALSDASTQEIQHCRNSFRSSLQKSQEMVEGLDKFLMSAQKFGAKTCIEKCEREMEEIMRHMENIERKVAEYERRLFMTEKHFNSRRRKAAAGHHKTQS